MPVRAAIPQPREFQNPNSSLYAKREMKTDPAAFWLPDGVRVGWGVSEVRAAFVTSPSLIRSFALLPQVIQVAGSACRQTSDIGIWHP
jgi:hypothetical protein